MTEDIQGFNIKLGLNTAEVDKGLKGLKREMTLVNSELDKNLSAFGKGERSMERYEATVEGLNRKLDVQQRTVDETRRKNEALRSTYDKQKQALDQAGKSVDENKRKYDQLNATYGDSAKEIQKVEKEIDGMSKEYSKLVKAAEKTAAEMSKVNKEFGEGSEESKKAQQAFDKQVTELNHLSDAIDEARAAQDKLTDASGGGVSELLKTEKALNDAQKEYTDLNKAVEKTSKELDNSEISLNNAEKKLNGIRGSLDRTTANMEEFRREQALQESSLNKFGLALEQSADDLEKFGDFADEAGNKLMILGAGIAGLGGLAGAGAFEFEKSQVRMQNSLGLTDAAAEELTETSKRIFNDGFGPSIEEVDSALIQTRQNIRDINDADLEEITKKALILSETFETDVNEVTRAANNLMQGFGIEADEAFDLMATGAQNGLNFSNELFDNLAEYSTLFGNMGYSAEEYFALLQSGYEAGVYNLDYINDVMKEFQIRIKDNSKGTAEAMAEMSENTQAVWQSFMDGEATVKDVMEAVTGDLEGMEDQTKANELGVQLFGTKFEDLEADAVYALGNLDSSLGDVSGTMDEMSANAEESIPQRALALWREAKDILMPLGEVLLEIGEDVLPAFESAVETATDVLEDMEPETLKNIAALGGILIAAGPVIKIIGGISKVAAPLVGGLGKLAGSFVDVGDKGKDASGKMGLLSGGLPVVGKALSKVHPVVGIAVGAIGLLGGGFALAKEKIDWFGNTIDLSREVLGEFNEFLFEITGITWIKDQFVSAWESTEQFRDTVGLSMDVIGGVISDTFNEKIVEPFENFKGMHREAGETVDVFEEDISEMTVSALENYVNLSENAKLALDELYFSQEEVTQAQVEDVQNKYQLMNDEALLKLEERRINEIEELNFLFAETGALTEAEREAILADTESHYLTEHEQLNANNVRIQEIIAQALEEEGGLQAEHYEQIEMLQGDHNIKTVETLSQGEIEQQAILERMSTNQLATSEETVNQLISDSEQAKNKTVEDAAIKRDEIVAEAIRQRDETGNLSAEEAQKIIDEAEKQYNETVSTAEAKHRDVISEASAQASEHGIIVDGETGEILSKWEVFARDTMSWISGLKDDAIQGWGDMWSGIGGVVEDGINSVIDSYNWLMDKLGLDGAKMGHVTIGSAPTAGGVMSGGLSRLPSYAEGTDNHPGGLAIVNDGAGPELLQSPSGEFAMAEGKNVLVNMAPGYKVFTAEQTRAMNNGAGGFLDQAGDVLGRGARWVGDKVSDIMEFASNPMALAEMALQQFGMSNPFSGASGDIISGMFNNFKEALGDSFKSMFAASAQPMPGILDPSNISYHYGHTAKYTAETGRYWHSGVDFPFVYDPIQTPIGGTVTIQPFDANGYGNWLTVLNGATKLLFAHLSKFGVSTGDRVAAGDTLGISGDTGFSTGPHLHLEYHDNGKVKDPAPWLSGAFRGSFANGGIISQHGIYEGAEGNLPEMVIPLTKPRRAMELITEAMGYMSGMDLCQDFGHGKLSIYKFVQF